MVAFLLVYTNADQSTENLWSIWRQVVNVQGEYVSGASR